MSAGVGSGRGEPGTEIDGSDGSAVPDRSDGGTEHAVAEGPGVERSPVDLLRAVVAAGLVIGLLALEHLFGDAIHRFLLQLLGGVSAIPDWLASTLVVATATLELVALVGGLAAAVLTRRLRALGTTVAAAIAGGALFALLDPLTQAAHERLVDANDVLGPLTGEDVTSAATVAIVAAAVTAAAPWLSRRARMLAWALVIGEATCRFLSAPVSFDTPVALAAGWLAGSLTLLAIGSPVRRPTRDALVDALRGVGVDLAELEPAAVDARGSTPYFGATTDGRRVFAKALGSDERSADLMFRAYRKVSPRDLGDERSFSTLRRAVEHEAFVSLLARDIGIRTPRVLGFAACEPRSFVLAYEGIDGRSLDRVDPSAFDDALLHAVWDQLRLLRTRRIAHRDLRLANLFLAADGTVWIIDFGFSEVAAADLLLATDCAELLASLTLVVGADRAVAAAVASVGPAAVASAIPRLRPFALSGATRTGMKEHGGLLDELRARVEAATPGAAAVGATT